MNINGKIVYLSFEEAREFVHSLNLADWKEWEKYCDNGEKPLNIPNKPDEFYKGKGWKNWSDWLGNNKNPIIKGLYVKKIKFLPFEEARIIVQSQNLKSLKEWMDYCKSKKKPNNIPTSPSMKYKEEGWVSWYDWLGYKNTDKKKNKFLPFKEAREYTRKLKLKNQREWNQYIKYKNKPVNIPSTPSTVYKGEGWISWGDWLGYVNIDMHNRDYLDFIEARRIVRSQNYKTRNEYNKKFRYFLKFNNIPVFPDKLYKDKGWISWDDWLGIQKPDYLKFVKARSFVRKLKFKFKSDWGKFCISGKLPQNIPHNPNLKYKNTGWISWGNWLGTDQSKFTIRNFLSFRKARKYIRALKLKNILEWKIFCNSGEKPPDIPYNPYIAYLGKGWDTWSDFLGTNNIERQKKEHLPFKKARKYSRSLKLKSGKEWENFKKTRKLKKGIPRNPHITYKGIGWNGWKDWLGRND